METKTEHADTREKLDRWYAEELLRLQAQRYMCAGWLYASILDDKIYALVQERAQARESPHAAVLLELKAVRSSDLDSWRGALNAGVVASGVALAELSEKFASSIPTIERWLGGTSQPVLALRDSVIQFLVDRLLTTPLIPEETARSMLASISASPAATQAVPIEAELAECFQRGYAAGLREGLQIAQDLGWVSDESMTPCIVWDDVVREIEARVNAVLGASSKTPDR